MLLQPTEMLRSSSLVNKGALNVPSASACEAGQGSWVSPASEAFPFVFPVFSRCPAAFSQPLQRQALAPLQ